MNCLVIAGCTDTTQNSNSVAVCTTNAPNLTPSATTTNAGCMYYETDATKQPCTVPTDDTSLS